MIDLHCHLDLYKDALTLLPQVASRNLFTLVVTTSPKAWLSTSRIFAGYENIEVAVGLHPEIVGQKVGERELLMSGIAKSRFVGEVGVDGSRVHKETISLQVSIFQELLIECEKAGGRIISVHSRNAVKQVLDLIEQKCLNSTPILHWFSGTIPQLHRAIDLGCWFSVGPTMLMGPKSSALLREMPIDRVLPESDGPFTTLHSEPLMPWDAIGIVETLESIWGIPKDIVYSQMELNLNALIR